MDAYALPAEWQRDAACAHAQFQSAAVPGQSGQEVHHRLDGGWLEQFWPVGFVSCRYSLAEVVACHRHTMPGRRPRRQFFIRSLLKRPIIPRGG
jgi:hypothetical protein